MSRSSRLVGGLVFAGAACLSTPALADVPMNYGETISGSIAVAGEVDQHTFTAGSGDVICVRVSDVGAAMEPSISLTGPMGTIDTTWDYTTAEIISAPITHTGPHTISVWDHNNDETGDYYLHLQNIESPASATALGFDTTHTGTVDYPTEMKAYTISGTENDKVLLRLVEASDSGAFYPLLRLYARDGTQVGSHTGSDAAELNAVTLPATGTYTVLAIDYYGTNPGSFHLHAQRTNNPTGATTIDYGSTLSGSITERAETVAYALSATDADVILGRLTETDSATEPRLRLYAPDGTQVVSAWNYTTAEFVVSALPETGTYTLLVMDRPGIDVGGYFLHVQDVRDPAGATALDFNATLTGTIGDRADTEAFTVSGDAGDRVFLRIVEAAGSETYYPQLRVYGPDGSVLASVSANDAGDINTLELPHTGTFTVLALDYYGTGTGDFHLHAQRTNDPTGATAMTYGQTLSGSVTQRAQTKAYAIPATTADVMLVRLTESTSASEPQMRLYAPDGTQVDTMWDYTTAEFLADDLPMAGDYTLLVMDRPGTDLVDYSLHVQDIHDPAGATPLGFNTTLTGAIASRAETAAFTVDGDASDHVLLRLVEAVGSETYYPLVRVYARDGTLLASATANDAAEVNTVSLPTTDAYTVLAMDYYGTNVGSFHLHAQRTNAPTGAVDITYGDTLAGSLTQRAQTIAYSLSAADVDVVLARVTEASGDMEPNIRLYAPDGVQIVGNWDYTTVEFLVTDMPEAGDYTLLVTDRPGVDLGDYFVHVQNIHDPADATVLDFNTTLTGTVDLRAETVAYTVTGNTADNILLRLVEAVGSETYYPLVRVYGRDGALLASATANDAAEINTVSLPASDTYTVLALDYYGTNTGSFHIHTQRTNAPTGAVPITWGETLGGTIDERAETVAYAFPASALDVVLARIAESGGNGQPNIRLYEPDGDQIAGTWDYTTTELLVVEPDAWGMYTLLITDRPGTHTFDYYVHLQNIREPANAVVLDYDATLSGNVSLPAEAVAFDIPETVEDTVFLRLVEAVGSEGYYPLLRLYGLDGTLLASATANDAAEINAVQLSQGGATVLALDYYGTATGAFTIHGQRTNDPVGATELEWGDTASGTIAERGESDAFTFVGLVDDVVTLTMSELTSDLEPQLKLYDPTGQQVAGIWDYTDAEIVAFALPDAGRYTLLAMDRPGLDTGDYGVEITGTGGAVTVPEVPVTAIRLLDPAPNPFNPLTAIRFELPDATPVELAVYAVDGRRIVTLVDGPRDAGRHVVVWHGRDAAGRPVSSGTYFVRMRADGEDLVSRATLVK